MMNPLHAASIALAMLALAGCASVSPDAGLGAVQALTRERVGKDARLPEPASAPAGVAATRDLLSKPLGVDNAVQIALLNNEGLKASLAELGVGAADVAQANRLPNPRFSFGNKRNGESTTIDRSVMLSVMSLLTMPLAQQLAGRQNEALRLRVASDVVRLATETRRAYFSAVAAEESVKYYEQVKLAAEAATELANLMLKAGNFNKLTQMREQVFHADATGQLARARLAAVVERERLSRLLGVSGADLAYRLPERLPSLPDRTVAPADAERTALELRLDVLLAKRETDAMAANLDLSRATRFINVLEVGYINESSTGEKRQNGYEIDVEIPLFDWGDARLARAEATYMQSVHRLQGLALTVRSEVRESLHAYSTAHELARHYRDEVVPLRKQIADENVLRYNGMLIGVFELLADARDQIASVNAYIDALKDFWIAEANLQMALSGTSSEVRASPRLGSPPSAAATGGH